MGMEQTCTTSVCKGYYGVTDVSLTTLELVKGSDGYYLNAIYRVETENKVDEYHLPRVRLPINEKAFDIYVDGSAWRPIHRANIGFGKVALNANNAGVCYTVETIETKTKEMTLEEIEKKLGHKVKIVNRED